MKLKFVYLENLITQGHSDLKGICWSRALAMLRCECEAQLEMRYCPMSSEKSSTHTHANWVTNCRWTWWQCWIFIIPSRDFKIAEFCCNTYWYNRAHTVDRMETYEIISIIETGETVLDIDYWHMDGWLGGEVLSPILISIPLFPEILCLARL